jgi:hypothetical protein
MSLMLRPQGENHFDAVAGSSGGRNVSGSNWLSPAAEHPVGEAALDVRLRQEGQPAEACPRIGAARINIQTRSEIAIVGNPCNRVNEQAAQLTILNGPDPLLWKVVKL